MEVLAIIPARSGSKSVPDKNIRLINDKPMFAYSIEHAKSSKKINRIIVSSDSEEYREIAKQYGSEAPFLRPKEFAQDGSLDIDLFVHALNWLKENEGYEPDIIVHLRPTYPIRDSKDIDNMIEMLEKNSRYDSVKSITRSKETPYRMWKYDENDNEKITPLLESSIPGIYNTIPRQSIPITYSQNCCIDVVRTEVVLKYKNMTGYNIAGYIMKYDFDIDYEKDFLRVENIINIINSKNGYVKSIAVDYDEFLCYEVATNTGQALYPKKKNVNFISTVLKLNYNVVVYSEQVRNNDVRKSEMQKAITEWGLTQVTIVDEKPYDSLYIDNACMEFEELLLQSLQIRE